MSELLKLEKGKLYIEERSNIRRFRCFKTRPVWSEGRLRLFLAKKFYTFSFDALLNTTGILDANKYNIVCDYKYLFQLAKDILKEDIVVISGLFEKQYGDEYPFIGTLTISFLDKLFIIPKSQFKELPLSKADIAKMHKKEAMENKMHCINALFMENIKTICAKYGLVLNKSSEHKYPIITFETKDTLKKFIYQALEDSFEKDLLDMGIKLKKNGRVQKITSNSVIYELKNADIVE